MHNDVLVFLNDGFEEMETVTPVDLLRRAGLNVVIASCGEHRSVQGRNDMMLMADVMLNEVMDTWYRALIVPGGPGVLSLREDDRVIDMLQAHHREGALIAAICAGPLVLLEAGLLAGHAHTAHFSVAEQLPAMNGTQNVVQDGRIITSRGAGTAIEFALTLVSLLVNPAMKTEVAKAICWPE